MGVFSKCCFCVPRRVDPDQEAGVSAVTLKRYQVALQSFVAWMEKNQSSPLTLDDLDAILVEYKNATNLTKSNLDYTIATLEWHIPMVKGKLPWSRKVAAGKSAANPTNHTVPLTSAPAKLFGAHLAVTGKPKMGFGLNLQQALGLRPSELLGLRARHVLSPQTWTGRFTFRLGAKKGTKVKREQVAFLDGSAHPELAFILLMLLETLQPDQLLFPFSYSSYSQGLKAVEAKLGVDIHVTPHSPRAGFASERVALGDPTEEIRRDGRWDSEQSFKTYIDIVAASQVEAMVRLSCHREALLFVIANFTEYFPEACFGPARHGDCGLAQRPRRAFLPSRTSTSLLQQGGSSAPTTAAEITKEELNARSVVEQPSRQRKLFGRKLNVIPVESGDAKGQGKGSGKAQLKKPKVVSSLGR